MAIARLFLTLLIPKCVAVQMKVSDEARGELTNITQANRTSSAQKGNQSRWGPGSPLLFIGINSAAGDTEMRDKIRDCYFHHDLLALDSAPMVAKFLVATPEPGSDVEKILKADMAAHPGQFVQVDSPEGYKQLTEKTIGFFRWAADTNIAQYVMKMDDDMYPNMYIMQQVLEGLHEKGTGYVYMGDLVKEGHPQYDGKYAEKWEVYNETLYPEYASGPGYVVGMDLVKYIFKDHLEENRAHTLVNEDVNTGLWTRNAQDDGIPVHFEYLKDRTDDGCRPIGGDSNRDRCCVHDGSR